jgi:antitoxin component YwqK of YwqJK toxin-antitoxin module
MVLFFACVVISGCGSRVPEGETTTKNGRLYRIGATRPYTGVVTGLEKIPGEPSRRFSKSYVKGMQEGHTYFYYPNGVIAAREYYRNGKANGIASYFYENGKIKARVHLENDLRGGEHGEAFYQENDSFFSFFNPRKSG